MRTKAKAESAALHAGLRKEQMKVESLERALQQKVSPRLPPASLPLPSPRIPAFPALSILVVLEVSSRFLTQKVFWFFWGVFFCLLVLFVFCDGLVVLGGVFCLSARLRPLSRKEAQALPGRRHGCVW